MIRLAIVATGLLAGCSMTVAVSSGAATAMTVGFTTAVIVGEELRSDRLPPPELAPDRVVAEQDCTRPIDETAGNLRCK